MNTYTHYQSVRNKIWLAALLLAPLFLSLSQFFWLHGVVTKMAGVLMVFSFFFWIFAFQALFHPLKTLMPLYAAFGFIIAVFSCLGGNNFGVDGIYGSQSGVDSLEEKTVLHQAIGNATLAYLFIPGALFPLSLLILGIHLVRKKILPVWIGILLCLGAVGFPLSRVPRIELLAHADNLILLISHLSAAVYLYRKGLLKTDNQAINYTSSGNP